MPRHIGTCFRFYTQMRVGKKTKHLPIKFIVTSHNSVVLERKQVAQWTIIFNRFLNLYDRQMFAYFYINQGKCFAYFNLYQENLCTKFTFKVMY